MSNQGSHEALLKLQMAPRLILWIYLGSKKRSPDIHVWVRPQPHIHREYGPRFPLSAHISYTMDYPTVLIGRNTPPKGKTNSVLNLSSSALQGCMSEQTTLYTSYSPAVCCAKLLLVSSFSYWEDWPVTAKRFLSLSNASCISTISRFHVNSAGVPPTLQCHWYSLCYCVQCRFRRYVTYFFTKLVGLQIKPQQYFVLSPSRIFKEVCVKCQSSMTNCLSYGGAQM